MGNIGSHVTLPLDRKRPQVETSKRSRFHPPLAAAIIPDRLAAARRAPTENT
jgi:hypothetical protein